MQRKFGSKDFPKISNFTNPKLMRSVGLCQTKNHLKMNIEIFIYDVLYLVLLQLDIYINVSRGILIPVCRYNRPNSGTQKGKYTFLYIYFLFLRL